MREFADEGELAAEAGKTEGRQPGTLPFGKAAALYAQVTEGYQ
jgi:hypothetical protein